MRAQPRIAFFFFNDTATTEIYTLSLHDALPICRRDPPSRGAPQGGPRRGRAAPDGALPRADRGAHRRPRGRCGAPQAGRSEEHTSELQSRLHLVCRLLLEKKKKTLELNPTAPIR